MTQQKFLSFVFFETRSPQSMDRTDLGAGSVNICEIYGDVKWWITNGGFCIVVEWWEVLLPTELPHLLNLYFILMSQR